MRYLSEETMNALIAFVDDYHEKRGYTPTISEIAGALSLAVGTVHKYLHRMADAGRIELAGRHIVTPSVAARQKRSVPVAGEIACGAPVLVDESTDEAFPLPAGFSDADEYFWLRARGRSMENAGIADGDLVLVQHTETLRPGDEATLKRFLPDPKLRKIVLRAENDDKTAYPDQIYDAILVRGVAVYVLKPLA